MNYWPFVKETIFKLRWYWGAILLLTLAMVVFGRIFSEILLIISLYPVMLGGWLSLVLSTLPVPGCIWRRSYYLSLPIPHKQLFLIQHIRLVLWWAPFFLVAGLMPLLGGTEMRLFSEMNWGLYYFGLVVSFCLWIQFGIWDGLREERGVLLTGWRWTLGFVMSSLGRCLVPLAWFDLLTFREVILSIFSSQLILFNLMSQFVEIVFPLGLVSLTSLVILNIWCWYRSWPHRRSLELSEVDGAIFVEDELIHTYQGAFFNKSIYQDEEAKKELFPLRNYRGLRPGELFLKKDIWKKKELLLHQFLKRDFLDVLRNGSLSIWVFGLVVICLPLMFFIASPRVLKETDIVASMLIIPLLSLPGLMGMINTGNGYLLSLPLPRLTLYTLQILRLLIPASPGLLLLGVYPIIGFEDLEHLNPLTWLLYYLGVLTWTGFYCQCVVGSRLKVDRTPLQGRGMTLKHVANIGIRVIVSWGVIGAWFYAWADLLSAKRRSLLIPDFVDSFLHALPVAEIFFPSCFLILLWWTYRNYQRWAGVI